MNNTLKDTIRIARKAMVMQDFSLSLTFVFTSESRRRTSLCFYAMKGNAFFRPELL